MSESEGYKHVDLSIEEKLEIINQYEKGAISKQTQVKYGKT